jgi:hypothetical protein
LRIPNILEEHIILNSLHELLRTVHREDEPARHLPRERGLAELVIGDAGKQQAFEKRPHLSGDVAKVDGRAQEEDVALDCFPEHVPQVVAHGAETVAGIALLLAREAACAALVGEVVEMEQLRPRPRAFGAGNGAL